MSLKQALQKTEKKAQDDYVFEPSKYPIKIMGRKRLKEQAAKTLDILMQSEFGKSLVENAGKNGYSLAFEAYEGSGGCCNNSKKRVMINTRGSSDNLKIAILSHELRHVWQQSEALNTSWAEADIKTMVIESRAKEADANVAAALVVTQLKDKGHTAVFEELSENKECAFLKAFDATYQQTNSETKALKAVFDDWYNTDWYKNWYENYYFVDFIAKDSDEIMNCRSFDKSINTKTYMQKLCVVNGENYMQGEDDNLLGKGKYVDISEKTKKALMAYFAGYQKVTGKKPDKSYLTLPIRGANKTDVKAIIKAKAKSR